MDFVLLHSYKDHITSQISVALNKIQAIEDVSFISGYYQSIIYLDGGGKLKVEEKMRDIIDLIDKLKEETAE